MSKDSGKQEEIQLVDRAMKGDEEAFNGLVKKYHKVIYAFAYRRLGNVENARDVTQEIFVRAFSSLPSLRHKDKFLGWLFGMANNVCCTFGRKLKRTPAPVEVNLEQLSSGAQSHHSLSAVEDSLERKNIRAKVLEAISELPENYQLPLLLRYLEEMSYAEIAETLEITRGSVVGILFRGTRYLRVKLKDYFSDRDQSK